MTLNVDLLKEAYDHAKYQYELIDRANDCLTTKAINMASFSGLLLGLIVNVMVDSNKTIPLTGMLIMMLGIVYISLTILFHIFSALVKRFKGLTSPDIILQKINGGASRKIFWHQLMRGSVMAVDYNAKVNKNKAYYIRVGDVCFMIAIVLICISLLVYLFYNHV